MIRSRTTSRRSARKGPRRAFSIIEMLVALTISGTLLTATLVALDVMFKRYTVISDSASSHVVARVVMQRIMGMIRTGHDFGPVPADVFNTALNPADYSSIEFVSFDDPATNTREITRIQRRASDSSVVDGEVTGQRGPFTLWLVIDRTVNGVLTHTERPMLDGVLDAKFNLEYDVGPRLVRATVDITIQPMGTNFAKYDADAGSWTVTEYNDQSHQWVERKSMSGGENAPMVRLVGSTSPRASVDE